MGDGRDYQGPVGALSLRQRFTVVRKAVGWRFIVYVLFFRGLLGGGACDLEHQGTSFMYMEYMLDPATVSKLENIGMIPSMLPVLIGLTSDMYPIWGYSKWPYLALVCLTGAVCLGVLWRGSPETLSIPVAVVCVFGAHLYRDWSITLTDAHIVQTIAGRNEFGRDLSLLKQTGHTFFDLVFIIIPVVLPLKQGVANFENVHNVYFICFLVAAVAVALSASNMAQEAPQTDFQSRMVRESFKRQWSVFATILALSTLTITPSVLAIFEIPYNIQALVAVLVAVLLVIILLLTIRRDIAGVCIFMFVSSILNVNLEQVNLYFITDTPEQFPGGPHLNASVIACLGLFGYVFTLLCYALYGRYLKNVRFQSIMMIMMLVKMAGTAFNLLLVSRLHTKVGIPDLAVLGCEILVAAPFKEVIWVAVTNQLGMITPRGMSGTIWGLMANSFFAGLTIANFLSSWLLDSMHVKPTGAVAEQEQFRNYPLVILIMMAMNVLLLCLTPLILPGRTDPLARERSAVSGAPVAQWFCLERNSPLPKSPDEPTDPLASPRIGSLASSDMT